MSGLLALIAPPDPVDTQAARAVHRVERLAPGELALRRAVLASAIDALRAGAERARRADPTDTGLAWRTEYAEDCGWFASADRSAPFAFAAICDVLGIDTQAAREAILGRVRDVVVPDLPAPSPRRQRAAERVWRWVEAQRTPWTVREAADDTGGVAVETVRGLVSRWVREGAVVRVGSGDGSRGVGLYRVARGMA